MCPGRLRERSSQYESTKVANIRTNSSDVQVIETRSKKLHYLDKRFVRDNFKLFWRVSL
jgi:hypothetical protein